MNPLVYLKNELGFKLSEFTALPKEYQTWYRQAARDEMGVLGIAVVEK